MCSDTNSKFTPKLFVISCKKIWTLHIYRVANTCNFLCGFSSNFQSSMTMFYRVFARMQNIPKFVAIIDVWMNLKLVGMTVFVNLFIESVTTNVTAIT